MGDQGKTSQLPQVDFTNELLVELKQIFLRLFVGVHTLLPLNEIAPETFLSSNRPTTPTNDSTYGNL